MSRVGHLRSVRVAPASCALIGCVLVLGTVVGQHGPADDGAEAASSPMAGMNMPGMKMSGAGASAQDVAGMDPNMPGMDMSGTAAGASAGGAPAGSPNGAATAPMDMSQPGMAAMMPGGFHTLCTTAKSCLVVFDKDATGTASVLGTKTSLSRLTATTARLKVDGKTVVLKRRKIVRTHGLTLQITRIDSTEVAIQAERT